MSVVKGDTVKDREEHAKRAVDCFSKATYFFCSAFCLESLISSSFLTFSFILLELGWLVSVLLGLRSGEDKC